jgi:hypothetical protein
MARQPGKENSIAVLGFQSWLAPASSLDKWPFSIQPDGRPMDILATTIAGKLTGTAEDLAIREFRQRVADATAFDFHEGETKKIAEVAVVGKKTSPRRKRQPLRV